MRRTVRVLAALAALSIVAAACGDDSGDGAQATTTQAAKEPKSGGTLSIGTFSETAGLDPIVSTGSGVTGYIELAAIYDTILRYNAATGKYEPNTAESVTNNADYTEWTVKLKPGIKFHDGTAYDAEAVKFGMNRHRSGAAGAPPCAELYACPRNSTSSIAYMALVKSIDVVDPLTVKFTLSEAWTTFPYALASEASFIPSPTEIKKCDPAKNVRECAFNLKPVGAGPFVIGAFSAKESITMTRNPNYHGGQVYLDGLRFVNSINDAGGPQTLNAFNAGTVNVAFLRDPATVASAKERKAVGASTMQQSGGIFLINAGATVNCAGGQPAPTCTGKPDGPTESSSPTKDIKVRQAIAAAIDPKVINDRGYQGKGLVGSQLLQNDFRWSPDVPGPAYNVDNAKKLVSEAKAAGWDGKVRMIYNNSPTAQAIGLAAQTLLQAVGIDVALDTSVDTTAQINKVVVQRDFDISGWGIAISPDDGAMWGLTQNFLSTSGSNRTGFKNTVVDQALRDLRTATTDDQKKAAYRKIAEQIATEVPVLPFAKVEEFIVWKDNVQGVMQVGRGGVLFDKAWIDS
jgi:peptide/nickel transport system substrate-binding protein